MSVKEREREKMRKVLIRIWMAWFWKSRNDSFLSSFSLKFQNIPFERPTRIPCVSFCFTNAVRRGCVTRALRFDNTCACRVSWMMKKMSNPIHSTMEEWKQVEETQGTPCPAAISAAALSCNLIKEQANDINIWWEIFHNVCFSRFFSNIEMQTSLAIGQTVTVHSTMPLVIHSVLIRPFRSLIE